MARCYARGRQEFESVAASAPAFALKSAIACSTSAIGTRRSAILAVRSATSLSSRQLPEFRSSGGPAQTEASEKVGGPIGIGFGWLSDRLRRQHDQNRNRETDAKRSKHARFPLNSMIGLPLPPIKPPRLADATPKHPSA
jgi:hypothetical protein